MHFKRLLVGLFLLSVLAPDVLAEITQTLSAEHEKLEEQLKNNPQLILDHFQNLDKPPNKKVDQIEKEYLLCQAQLALTYPNLALKHAEAGLALIKSHKHQWLRNKILLCKATSLEFESRHKEALPLTHEVVIWAENHLDNWLLIDGLIARGHIYNAMTLSADALKDFQRAYDLAPESGGKINKGEIAADIALVYEYKNDSNTAIQYYQEAIDYLADGHDDQLTLSIVLYGLGRSQVHNNDLDLGFKNLQESARLAKEINDIQGEAYALKELANISSLKGQKKNAINTLNGVMDIFKEANNDPMMMEVAYELCHIYTDLKQYDEAQKQLMIMKSFEDENTLPYLLASNLSLEAKLLNLQGDHQKAYQVLLQAMKIQSTQKEQQISQQISRIQQQYDFATQQKENALLLQQNLLQQQKIKAQQERYQLQTLLVLAFAITSLLLIVIIYRSYKHRQKLQYMANHDSLTGLLNRKAATIHVKSKKLTSKSNLVVMLDLDHFKRINDRFGHTVGDEVLITFAQLCHKVLPENTTISRLGGEEFLVIFYTTKITEAMQAMYQLKEQCAQKIILDDPDFRVTFSAGITQFKKEDTLEQAIQHADMAMYRAKSQGRNRIIVYHEMH